MTCIATAPVSPSRAYQYDTLGRPTSRTLARQGATRNDVFTYNDRSELISDVVDGTGLNGWDYDNIGNRLVQQQGSACDTYTSNALNQYTAIEDESHDVFTPTYDDDGNQTRIKTSTGIWNVTYNAKNRPVLFTKDDNSVSVACTYDYMGRRATKVVTENGVVTTSHRFLYRGYLQIACCDRKRSTHPCLWLITWDPTQDVATRPLAIQKDGTWYTYGWDLTKNIWEAYTTTGYIGTAYTYTAFGLVTASGAVVQPIQWSSEYSDSEIDLVYYNYRHYSTSEGKWMSRDIAEEFNNLTLYISNSAIKTSDSLGLSCNDEKKDFCGPDVTSWLKRTMHDNLSHPLVILMQINTLVNTHYYGLAIKAIATLKFIDLVKTNAPWDFKNSVSFDMPQCPSKSQSCKLGVTLCGYCLLKENIGNIHYGWIGRALGFSPEVLLNAASAYQTGGPDEKHDQAAIQIGIDLYDKKGSLCAYINNKSVASLKASGIRDLSGCQPCQASYE